MTKQFAMIVGWVLILVGVVNFFDTPLMVWPAHAVFHIVAGILGVWLAKEHSEGYTMWVGIVGVVLAIIGFVGVTDLLGLGLIDLPVIFNWIHLILGVVGFIVFFSARKGMKPAMMG